MPRSTALAKGARITGGLFCLLFFLFSAYWLAVDIGQFGIAGVWDSWTGARAPGTNEVGNPVQLGVLLLQLTAFIAAFAGRRAAGGLLAVATTLTFATALQALVSVGNHTADDRWFLHADTGTSTFKGVFLSSLALFPLSVVAGIVLLAGMRSWPRTTPSQPPVRPAAAAGVIGGLVLGAMALGYAVWQVYMLVQGGSTPFAVLYLGRGILTSLLSLAPGWYAVVFFFLTAIAGLNSLTRGTAARGLSFGLAIALLPNAVLTVIAFAHQGILFKLDDTLPGLSVIRDAQLLLDLLGSLALCALMARGVPVAPGWQPPAPMGFAAPGYVPQGPAAMPQAGWQQPGPPPMPPVGGPPMPPGNPPPPQGGYGPPAY
ncbi:hypothetical protein GCM10010211_19370 [Streptomyces albospinus]|uniref:Uncharacterized protein n=1 Tax=Streptomyces albospinus TaxID=285515 RepID=A0ABQ2UWM9_9ACTN|nr:hypothetical protein [Streptomyces albospinus]GGU54811.1 hypothetical protein GCM10010211_19370 [Streptomyces albospinus]